jgi:glycosyltransferase involved in cell wall biosynthesis
MKVSIIIPSRNEKIKNLERTLDSIYANATGEFEVIVGFDGQPYYIPQRPNCKYIHFSDVVGIKSNINALCAMATGKYIFKLDAHCSVGKGFDEILQADMQENWIVMPRFYVLKEETWEWQDERFYDYFYLCCPFTDPKGFRFKAGGHWPERTAERLRELIDETPQIHGSGWFMSRDYYFDYLNGFPNIDPHGHAQEPIWLALKNWLIGGKVMVNKKTWYAHLHQDHHNRGYSMDKAQENRSYELAVNHFMREPKMEWFIDKFMPMPTWPSDWKERLNTWLIT